MDPDEQLDNRVTLRDLLRVEATQKEILAELKALDAKIDARFELHAAKHQADTKAHADEHKADHKAILGWFRWSVSTIIPAIGALIALYVAFKGAP